jgi:hypothetical protein
MVMPYYVAVLGRRNANRQRNGKVLASGEEESFPEFRDRAKRQRGTIIGSFFCDDEQGASRVLRRALKREQNRISR